MHNPLQPSRRKMKVLVSVAIVISLISSFLPLASTQVLAGAGVLRVQSTSAASASGNSLSLAFPSSNTAGNLLLVVAETDDSGTITVSDSLGNVYTRIKNVGWNFGLRSLSLYYALSSSGGANSVTLKSSTTGGGKQLQIFEYSGIASTSPLDQSTSSASIAANGMSITTPNVTTTQANELLFAVGGPSSATSGMVPASGYTLEAKTNIGGSSATIASEDNTSVASVGSYNATLNWTPGQGSAGIILATFKAGVSAPDTTAPSVPTNLAAIAVSSSQINLSWAASTDNVGVAGYQIFRNGTQVATSTTASYADSGLSASTSYTYTITAFDAAGNVSSQSTQAIAVTQVAGDITPPTVPANVTATAISVSQINLSWAASTDNVGVAGYSIYRGGVLVASTTTTSYSDTGLSASTQYSYTVAAFDAAGNASAQSSPVLATTQTLPPDTTPPTTPTNLTATAISSSQINLSWTASTDNVGVTGYKIYRGGVQVGTSGTNSYSDSALTASTQYIYTVAAFDAAGNVSSQSSSASATTQAGGAGTGVTTNTWNKMLNTTGYPVEILGYDKAEYIPSRNMSCVWGAYKEPISSEPNDALVCYSYADNRWSVLENNGFFHSTHEPSSGHSISMFSYITDKDTLVFMTDGSGSNVAEKIAGHWWWFDMGGLTGQDKTFSPKPWLGALTPLGEMVTYDQFDQKLIMYDQNGAIEVCDPNSNVCSLPTVTGTPPPTFLASGNMVYDSQNHSMYIYGGGQSSTYTLTCTTTACTTVTAVKLTVSCTGVDCVSGLPPARLAAGMAYSPKDNIFLMAGGINFYGSGNISYNDTWTFDPVALAWKELSPSSSYFGNTTNPTFDRLTYDSVDNVFLMISSNAFAPTEYAFPYSPAQNYGRTSASYAPPAGSLNRAVPTASSQSSVFDPAIAASGSKAYLAWEESGSNSDLTNCGNTFHPAIQSLSGSTWTVYPSCTSIDPEDSGSTETSKVQIAVVNGTLWETHEKSDNTGTMYSQAFAKQWNGSTWVGGPVGCFSGTCAGSSGIIRQNPQAIVAVGNTPTIAAIEWNTNNYTPEGYLYVSQYNGSTWTALSTKLNANPANSGTQVLSASMATDGTNPAVCWSEQVVVNRNTTTVTPQIHCSQYNGSSWIRWDSSTFNINPGDWASDPSVTFANGKFYVAWTERTTAGNTQLYACQWNGSACNLIGTNPLNISGASSWAAHPSLATDGTNVYLGWEEQATLNQHSLSYVKKWNGNSWSQLGGPLNADPINGSTENTSLAVVGGQPTAVWTELTYGSLRQVYAKQWNGSSWVSSSSGWNTSDTIAPTVPTGLVASSTSATTINVTWSPSADNVGVAGYQIFRNGTQVATSTAVSYADTGLIPSTSYSYSVSAYDAAGNVSAQSSPVVGSTQTIRIAASYYVSPSGSDSNAGTSPSAPWQTIVKVNSTNFIAGDKILFLGGQTFSGKLAFGVSDSGTAANPVVITSYGTGRAVINGGNAGALYAYNVAGLDLENINFAGNSSTTNTDNGVSFYMDMPGSVKLDTITINNVDISGFGKSGLSIGAFNGTSGYKNIRITNITSHDNADSGINLYGFTPQVVGGYALQNVYIGSATVYNNTGISGASQATGNGIVISNTDGGVIENSSAYNNGSLNTNAAGPVGIWAYESNNITIQHNESYNNHTQGGDGGGFDLDGGVTNSVMQYNYSHGNDGAGYLLAQYSGARTWSGNTVRYNISENDGRKNSYAGIQLWNGGSGVTNADVYNNTVYVSPSASGQPKAVWAMTPTSNVHFRNNIFVVSGGLFLTNIASGQTGMVFDHNDYWASGGALNFTWGNASLGSGELQADPQLLAPGAGGTIGNPTQLPTLSAYTLNSSSPVINAGADLTTLGINPGSQDFYGNPVKFGTGYDMGADELMYTPDTQAPSVPSGLSASAVSSSEIDLSWTASTDNVAVAGYQVFRDGSVIATTSAVSYQDVGLQPASSHSYFVSAFDSADNVSAGSTSTVSTTLGTSPIINSFTAASSTIMSGASTLLSWSVSGTPAPILSIDQLVGNVSSSSSVTITPATTTTYTLTATNSAGTITATVTVVVIQPVNQPPVVSAGVNQSVTLPVASITLNGSATDDGLPNPPGILTYAWTEVSGPASTTIVSSGNAVTQVANVAAAGVYVFKLTAFDGSLLAASTTTVTVNAAPDTTAPVVNLNVQDGNGNPITATSTVAGTLTFTVTGSDPQVANQVNAGVASITLALDGVVVASSTGSSLLYNLNTTTLLNSSHQLIARVIDNAGNVATSSIFQLNAIGFLAGWQ